MAKTKTGESEKTDESDVSRASSPPVDDFSRDELHGFMREMLLYRRFEEKAEEAYAIGKIGGFCHLHIGQEAVALGFIKPLRQDDYVISTYREHTQALAKGMGAKEAMAELYGRSDGCSKGKGGSMHLFDVEKGFMGGHGIVGAQVPLAAGFGWKIRYREEDGVCVCFLGDAAVNQGAFHEALNMSAVWKLPVIYVVENNEYGMGTHIERVSATPIVQRSCAYGIPGHVVNGQDALEVYSFTRDLVEEVRKGAGPQFVEAQTYRFKGHSMSDPVAGTYRTREELDAKQKGEDPILLLKERLFDADLMTQEELEKMDAEVKAEVGEAAEFADGSPPPSQDDLYDDVYAELNQHGRLFLDGRER